MDNLTVGDVARLSVEITDISGTLADPSTISLYIKPPSSAAELHTSDIVKDAVGKYHFDLSLGVAGSYGFRWQTTGANQGVTEGGLYVYPQQVV